MYSIVLMMAMTSPADDVALGRRGDCGGGGGFLGRDRDGGCSGYGSGYSTGCNGSDRGGFLGLRNRGGRGCSGADYGDGCHGNGRGGFKSRKRGGSGCHGYHAAACGCSGVTAPAHCGGAVIATGGCIGTPGPVLAPAGGGAPPPVRMPEPPVKNPPK